MARPTRNKRISNAMKFVDEATRILVAEQRLEALQEDNFMSKNRM